MIPKTLKCYLVDRDSSVWLQGTDSEVHLTNQKIISHQVLIERHDPQAGIPRSIKEFPKNLRGLQRS